MPWSANCPHGGPDPFDPAAAIAAVDFAHSVCILTANAAHQAWQRTRYALVFVHVTVGQGARWTVSVMVHIHWYDLPAPGRWVAGNTYIPGWANCQAPTSAAHLAAVAALADQGAWPDGDRFPRPGVHLTARPLHHARRMQAALAAIGADVQTASQRD